MAVCLHCLHAERVAATERRQRILVRAAVGVIIFAVITAGANAGWRSFRDTKGTAAASSTRRGSKAAAPRQTITTAALTTPPETPIVTDSIASTSASQPLASTDRRDSAAALPLSVSAASDSAVRPASTSPSTVLPPGRTELPDSLFAVRTGDTVVVHFDTSPARTRRADKFDRVVRQTLPAVYGPLADSALALVAEGKLANAADLLTELPTRGIHLQLPGGYRISLWPETRQGRDGPLVVAYRTVIAR
jgi:hypothetical protein